MHPNPIFRSDADPLARAAAIGFAHIVAITPEGPMVVHGPVTRHDDALRFHVARANRLAGHLDGATVLLSLVGPHGYISPNWYERPGNQVPTWNFVAVEIDGLASAVADDLLVEHLDTLAAVHEPRSNRWDARQDGQRRVPQDAKRHPRLYGGGYRNAHDGQAQPEQDRCRPRGRDRWVGG